MDDVNPNKLLVVDATDLILGRLSSLVAKRLLLGELVTIVNVERATISGSKPNILAEIKVELGKRTLGSKDKSPKRPHRPEGIVRRAVRGMLPMDKPKGKEAFSHLRAFVGLPTNFDMKNAQNFREARRRMGTRLMTVGELAQSIGWKPLEVK